MSGLFLRVVDDVVEADLEPYEDGGDPVVERMMATVADGARDEELAAEIDALELEEASVAQTHA